MIDSQLTLDNNLSLFDHSQPTLCYNLIKEEEEENLTFVKLDKEFTIRDILQDLNHRRIQSLIVEGGSFLLQKFISEEQWDEARVFIAGKKFGGGIPAPLLSQKVGEIIDVMGDQLYVYKNDFIN